MMKKIAVTSVILLLLAVILPLIFSAAHTDKAIASLVTYNDVYVAASQTVDSGNGSSWATAKKYIQSGIDIVNSGGRVHVASGTYNEHNIHLNQSFDLVGAGASTTIIDGGGLGQVLYIASFPGQSNTISGFTIQNGHVVTPLPPPAPADEGHLQGAGPGMAVGGGVYVAYGHKVILNNCTIKNNTADFLGGGVYNAGEITLNGCTLSGNTAAFFGGGIANFVDSPRGATPGIDVISGTMTLINCTISGNSVTGALPVFVTGAGYAVPGYAEPVHASLGGPIAELPSLGGGVYNGGSASFLNVTIANNTASGHSGFHGGGFANIPLQCVNDVGIIPIYTPDVTFENTIVANNAPDNGYNIQGTVISHGYNLDSQNTCGFNSAGDQINTNPLLGPLHG